MILKPFQHTAARRRLLYVGFPLIFSNFVSTHSRAEAAAYSNVRNTFQCCCFNTQPRGGGCVRKRCNARRGDGFNTQPRGGGCDVPLYLLQTDQLVSTHSRAEAAAGCSLNTSHTSPVSTHSRAEAAAGCSLNTSHTSPVSTHSRAEAAATVLTFNVFFQLFQHTAARRRLLSSQVL